MENQKSEKVSIRGRIHAINPTEEKSPTFKKRDFVIKTEGQYPQFIKVQLTQDKCGLLDGTYKLGQDVEAFYNLQGREVNKNGVQYYNTIEVWRLVSLQEEPNSDLDEFDSFNG